MDAQVRRVALGLALALVFAPAAHADPLPASPNSVDGANRWINPAVRAQDATATISLEITEITTTGAGKRSVSAVVRNDADQAVETLELVTRYADPEASVAGLRTVLAADATQFPHVLPALNLGPLAPGEQRSVVMELPELPGPAVYPMLVGVQSAYGLERTQRFLYSAAGTATGNDEDAEEEKPATPVTVVMPITASVDIVGGETGEAPQQAPLILASEQLGEQLAPGGRLHTLIHSIPQGPVRQATCLALDPQLVETVMRMASGYTVAATRPSSVSKKKRLRDSWTLGSEESPKQAGAHAEDAQAWLDDLNEIASCSVALPWANTDLNAVEATENPWLMREALQRGTQVLRAAGLSPMTNVVIPGGGYINPETVPELGFADYAGAENGTNGLTTDINAAWEAAREREGGEAPERAESEDAASSLDAQTSTGQDTLSAPVPTVPVSVLVADNTVNAPQRFATLGENIHAVTYQGSLAATLAEAIASPMTVGYGNYFARFDYALDSQPARTATANAAITASLSSAGSVGSVGEQTPVLMMLPSDAEDPSTWLRTLAALIEQRAAQPLTLAEYLDPGEAELPPTDTGTPYDDPTVIADTEILQARQQADYTDDLTRLMINDPAIALTPYNFTAPVRHEVLRALSRNGRGSILTFDAKVNQARETLSSNRAMLSELRASVSLLPPGNVYTRLSDGSPLLIAAQNGLPLPVDARIRYTGPPGASINVEEIVVPAKGSMTVQMTANLPTTDRTDLDLWLATPQGAAISHPVSISVQTRSGIFGASGAALVLVLGLVAALAVRVVRRRKKATLGE